MQETPLTPPTPSAPMKLWNKNFTIITFGTVVSMLGNSISGFAISLLVLDFTDSIFLYTLAMVAYNLPKIIMPLIAGPYLDNFSRAKVIYTLDFLSSAIYLCFGVVLLLGWFNYGIYIVAILLVGSIDSIYSVAYDSLYPMLVHKENFSKAYSISSMIYPIASFMVPVAAWLYGIVGVAPLMFFNAATFLLAAIFETFIKVDESQIKREVRSKFNAKKYFGDFKEGVKYILSEKGLLMITCYFFITAFSGASSSLVLPYFKSTPDLGVFWYTLVMGASVLGRLIGGGLHYKLNIPTRRRFTIALSVYFIITLIEAFYLFTPIPVMIALMFTQGLLAVNSYNIRISSTQNYVPNEKRGRFNGAFAMMTTMGGIVGQLLGGALADSVGARAVILAFYAVNFVAIFAIMVAGGKHVKKIYNAEIK